MPRTEVRVTVNYPLWDLFLTMLELFIWIVLIVLVVWVIFSILRSHDLSAWAKVGWLIFVIVLPFIGVFTYLIIRGAHLAGEQVATANAPQDERFRGYQRFEAQGKNSADELAKLSASHPQGHLKILPNRSAQTAPQKASSGPTLARGVSATT